MMKSSRLLVGLLIAVLAVFGVVLWHQQQVISDLSAGAQTPVPANRAELGKTTPALSNVALDVPLAGAPSQGSATAAAVFLEFSDFQCPYCGRYQRDTYPRLLQDYVSTGKVRYVFRQLPLESLHKNAMNAAVLASCSAAQGKFWEVHDRLFAHQDQLEMPALFAQATGLGMDELALRACFDERRPAGEIAAARADAIRAGFTGTPGFLVGTVTADGVLHATRRLYGANPYSLFQSAIEDVLAGRQ